MACGLLLLRVFVGAAFSGLWWGGAAIAAAAAVSFVTLTFFRSRPATQAAPQA